MMDIKTLYLSISLINIFLCIAMFAAWKFQKVYDGFGFWVMANFVLAFGYIFLNLTANIFPPVINILTRNLAFVLAAWFRLWGLYLFFGEKHRLYPHFTGIALFLAVQFYFSYFSDDIAIRTVVLNLVLCFYLFVITRLIISHTSGGVIGLYRFTASIFFIYGLVCMSRLLVSLIFPSQLDLTQTTTANELHFLVVMLLDIGVIFALLMINAKRLSTDLIATQKTLISAQESIRASLYEKELLLKEIHHRVKNNLQIITSLLSLQAENVDDKKILDVLKESKNRVHTMADIHTMLYQSKDLANIEFENYIRKLINSLFISYKTDPDKIKADISAKGILFPIETAIPCSLIINELVSNALKYAFPEGRTGNIRVKMSQSGNMVSLNIRDNGIGIPENFDNKSSGALGLHLVNAFVEQLQGSIELRRNDGTEYIIVFAAEEQKEDSL